MARLTVYLRPEQLPPPGGLVMAAPRGTARLRTRDWRVTRVTEENRPWLLRAYHATSLRYPVPAAAGAEVAAPTWDDVRAAVEAREAAS